MALANLNSVKAPDVDHSAVAQGAYRDETKVSAVLSDLDSASVEEPLRATLLLLGKLTREHAVDMHDMRAVLAAGASRPQIEDALAVCFSFNVIGRLADAFGFFVPAPRPSRLVPNTCSHAATADSIRGHVAASGAPEFRLSAACATLAFPCRLALFYENGDGQ
jgi:hypothetical protein